MKSGSLPNSEEKNLVIKALNDSHGDIAKASLKFLDLLNDIWSDDTNGYSEDDESIANKPYHLVADETLPEQVVIKTECVTKF